MVNQFPPPTEDVCGALSTPIRRRMIELLGERPRSAGELATAFSVSAPAISRHLGVLRGCALVEEHRPPKDRRVRLYRLRPEPLGELSAWIERVSSFWDDRLAAFKEYVEEPEHEGTER